MVYDKEISRENTIIGYVFTLLMLQLTITKQTK